MRKLPPRLAAAVLAAPLASALLAHAYVGLFSRYWYDDFCTAAVLRDMGFVGSQRHWYLGWSGRFSFHFLVNLLELAGPRVVPFLPLAALAAWTAVSAWAAYQAAALLRLPRRGAVSFLGGLLVVFATLNSTPDVAQSLYWQTGMLTYLAPLVLFTAYAGLVASSVREGGGRVSRPRVVLCLLLTLAAGGLSEVTAVLQAAGACLLAAAALTRGRARFGRGTRALILAGLAGALVALLAVVLAPGNKARQALMPPHSGWLWSVESSFRFALYFFEQHTRRWRGTAFLAFALPAWLVLAAHYEHSRRSGAAPGAAPGAGRLLKLLACGIACGFLLIVLCLLPGFYAQAEALPRRTHIVPKFVLVGTTVYCGVLAGLALLGRFNFDRGGGARALLAGGVAVLALLAVSPAAAARRTFALGARARAYAERWDELERQIRAAAAGGARQVTVRGLEGEQWELGFGRPDMRLAPDPKAPQNVYAAWYYGLDSIRAE